MISILRTRIGFTLIETVLVVAIIGALASIAVPALVKTRQTASKEICLVNVRKIQDALNTAEFYGVDISNLADDAAIEAIIVPDYIKTMPDCRYGDYSTDADGNVHCSLHNRFDSAGGRSQGVFV